MVLTTLVRQLRDSRAGADGRPGGDRAGGDRWPATAGETEAAGLGPETPLAIRGARLLVLLMVLVTVPFASVNPGAGPKTGALTAALVVSALSWVVWELFGRFLRMWMGSLVVMAAAGGVLAGLSALSPALAVGIVVITAAGARLPTASSLAIVAETIAAFLITGLTAGAPTSTLAGYTAAFAGMWAFGLTRRAHLLRAMEAEEALAQARLAQAAQTQAAALAERARIAREIHDVLAHSLAAVSVNLQAAEGLLDAVPDKSAEVAKAMECLQRAGALTREGMAETRRAILALREDEREDETGRGDKPGENARGAEDGGRAGAGAAGQLPGRLRALVEEHRAAGDADVTLTVAGQSRPLSAEVGLTAYRTVQEALTNARKHAPGQPVTVALSYLADAMTLQVSNPLPSSGTARPLAGAGVGYGLTGLGERAALAGGTLQAGPDNGYWRISLRIPA